MERHSLSMAMLAVVFALICLAGKAESSTGLEFKFYKKTCPTFESVVQRNVNSWYWKNRNSSASLLRFFFNDCFAEGCRGSLTLTNSAQPNLVVLGDIKKELESDKKCKGKVSCADILAMAAVYGLKQLGGPLYEMKLGRRDSFSAYASTNIGLPHPNFPLKDLRNNFTAIGLNDHDLVALSGAHTIGRKFVTSFLDPVTPFVFDNQYYKNLLQDSAVAPFESDIELLSSGSTKKIVKKFAENNKAFLHQFGKSLAKMGRHNVLTGQLGTIRSTCTW